ncbi:MAG: hypothetical protein M1405_01580 [Patescibacteria group bacterium]|nr:hypothetical protein [Patescibacteria group bacterium]
MSAEIPRSQDKVEAQATKMQRLGYFLASVGVVLIGRALIVNNDVDFIRGVEVVGGTLSLASSLLSFEEAKFFRGQVEMRRTIDALEKRLDPYGFRDTSSPPVGMTTEY